MRRRCKFSSGFLLRFGLAVGVFFTLGPGKPLVFPSLRLRERVWKELRITLVPHYDYNEKYRLSARPQSLSPLSEHESERKIQDLERGHELTRG